MNAYKFLEHDLITDFGPKSINGNLAGDEILGPLLSHKSLSVQFRSRCISPLLQFSIARQFHADSQHRELLSTGVFKAQSLVPSNPQ